MKQRGLVPIKFCPIRIYRLYTGGLLLDEWQGITPAVDGSFPERWIASTVEARNPGEENVTGLSYAIMDGQKITLRQLIAQNPEGVLGENHVKTFGQNPGVLVKILDSCSRLMIQVHPDKEKAKRYFASDYGKTEAWHILGTREINGQKPYVLLGFQEGITKEKWQACFESQNVDAMLSCLHKIEVQAGETYFITGGVPHAMGSGVFFAEIQEPTDFTLRTERLAPDGKPISDEQMHQGIGFAAMFDCFSYDGKSLEKTLADCRVAPQVKAKGQNKMISLISYEKTPYFSMEKWELNEPYTAVSNGTFCSVAVLSGSGKLLYKDGEISLNTAEELFVPAEIKNVTFTPLKDTPLCVLVCRPPKI